MNQPPDIKDEEWSEYWAERAVELIHALEKIPGLKAQIVLSTSNDHLTNPNYTPNLEALYTKLRMNLNMETQ